MKIDQELLELFETESKENFELCEESLLALEKTPEDEDRLNELFRGLHTLKGVFNMLDLKEMGQLAHAAEGLAGLYRDEGAPVTGEGLDLLFKTLDTLREMANGVIDSGGEPPVCSEPRLTETVRELCERLKGGIREDVPVQEGENGAGADVESFRFFVGEELPALKKAVMDALETGQWNDAVQKAEVLEFVADDLGFHKINGLFAQFIEAVKEEKECPNREEILDMLQRIEDACFAAIEMDAHSAEIEEEGISPSGLEEANGPSSRGADEQSSIELAKEFFLDDSQDDLTDEDLAAFLLFLEEEFPRLQNALEEAVGKGAWLELEKAADIMEYAAGQLGLKAFSQRLGILKGLSIKAREGMEPEAGELEAIKQDIVQGIMAIKELAEKRGILAGPSEKELSSLFLQRIVTDSEAMNARLRECSDAVRYYLELMKEGKETEIDPTFPEEAVDALRLLYHFAVFYDLKGASEAILILEDIYNRIGQGELAAAPRLPDLTDELTVMMQQAFEAIREKRPVDTQDFDVYLVRLRNFVAGLPENRLSGVSKSFIHLLDISPGFLEVATPESNAKIGEAFKKGELFYEITVDLDSYPDIGDKFMGLEAGGALVFITNETIYEGERSLYNFLVSSHMPEDELRGVLIDTIGDRPLISIRRCRLREERAGGDAMLFAGDMIGNSAYLGQTAFQEFSQKSTQELSHTDDHAIEVSNAAMEEVIAISGSIHHIVTGLEQMDFEDLLSGLMANDAHKEGLKNMLFLLRNLVQVDRHLLTALEDLQNGMEELTTISSEGFLQWMALSIRNIAAALGINVKVEIKGTDAAMPRTIVSRLRPYMKQLLRACIEPCMENARCPVITIKAESRGDALVIGIETGMDIRGRTDALNKIPQGDLNIIVTAHETGVNIRLPSSNALVNGIVVRKHGMNFVIPVKAVKRILEPEADAIVTTSCDEGYRFLRIEGELVGIRPITTAEAMGDGNNRGVLSCGDEYNGHGLIIVVEGSRDGGLAAFEVDDVLGQEQLRVTPLTGHLRAIEDASGCAILGNGDVAVVIEAG